MKTAIQKRCAFIAKSMLWSALLYVVLMVAFNWEDVSNKVRGANPITVISSISSQQTPTPHATAVMPNISQNTGVIKKIIILAKNIGGIVSIVTQ